MNPSQIAKIIGKNYFFAQIILNKTIITTRKRLINILQIKFEKILIQLLYSTQT